MAVVSTGFFDGVHSGHRNVIRTLVSEAQKRREESLVVTFWPHPRILLQDEGASSLRLLTILDEKKALLSDLGVDRIEVIPFTREFASLSAEEYLETVVKREFGASAIVFGYDNRIGSDMRSSFSMAPAAERIGLEVITVPEFRPDDPGIGAGTSVSSTVIRKLLADGEVGKASLLLGRDYSLTGSVVGGKRIGRGIGFPTANIQVDEPIKLVPAQGVYLSSIRLGREQYRGMTFVGPETSPFSTGRRIETNIFDFDADIYGRQLELSFVRRLRDVREFGNMEDLRCQLLLDRAACMDVL